MTGALLLFFGLFPLAVFAHNGQVALAVPVQGIAVDGDLGDWPAEMQLRTRADHTGRYAVEMPAGSYRVAPGIGGEQREVEVNPGSAVEANLGIRPPEGKVIRAGEGRRKKMGSGVHREPWIAWGRPDGLPAYVPVLVQDQRGNMWFVDGVGKAISYCDGENCVEFTSADGLPAHGVLALHADSQGNMWLGTDGGGVVRYDGKEFKTFTTREGLAHDVVKAIA